MYKHGDDLGPKKAIKEDNIPSDIPYNQPQDDNTPQWNISGKYYNNAYQMHIENWEILSPGRSTLDRNGEKALALGSLGP